MNITNLVYYQVNSCNSAKFCVYITLHYYMSKAELHWIR